MTLDEAIKHCEEVAEQNEFETRIYDELNRQGDEEYRNNHCQCAAEHRQLAEWLTELKEAKRLLKAAVEALNDGACNKDCRQCESHKSCDYDNRFKWKHTIEALALIGEEGGNNA